MFDYQTIKLLHRHGDDDYAPMVEGNDHDSATHDPERSWLRGAKIFHCTKCEDSVVITSPASTPTSDEPGQGA
jgi:hypothetical protein